MRAWLARLFRRARPLQRLRAHTAPRGELRALERDIRTALDGFRG